MKDRFPLDDAEREQLDQLKAKLDSDTITVTCTYADGDTITTKFNGTPEDARKYFVGQTFNIGSVDDNMQECVSITIHGHAPMCTGIHTADEPCSR